MTKDFRAALSLIGLAGQQISMVMLVLFAIGWIAYSAACFMGSAQWLVMSVTLGEITYPEAGMAVQLGLTGLVVAFCFYLPSNRRIIALENSHRKFHVEMQDVAHAYVIAHNADRQGNFNIKSEFDSVRARIKYLRDHPDLRALEPDVMEIAAQMSHVSEELAKTYSDNNVERAKGFLTARQAELDLFNTRLEEAKRFVTEIRRWVDQVELEESVADSELRRLQGELEDILPDLVLPTRDAGLADGPSDIEDLPRRNVTPLKMHSAE